MHSTTHRSIHLVLATTIWVAALASTALGDTGSCGTPKQPCILADGEYYAAVPRSEGQLPAVIWLHGYARSGKAMIQKAGYVKPFVAQGFAVIMPSGQRLGNGSELDWGVADGYEYERDDVAFIRAVRSDATDRFNLDPSRILIAGFSRGGSMVWDLACKAPDLAKGYAAVAGAFWEPMHDDCAAPVHLFHTHGFKDRMVPFEGREMTWKGDQLVQGSVMKGIDIWRRKNTCLGSAENSFHEDGSMQKDWKSCDSGSIRLKLTKGGHGIPNGWREDVLDWFSALD